VASALSGRFSIVGGSSPSGKAISDVDAAGASGISFSSMA